jgi:hypothetical protein
MQAIVALLMIAIVFSLLKAMMHMSHGDRDSRMVHALTARVVLSMALFGLLYLSQHFGWMQSHAAQ